MFKTILIAVSLAITTSIGVNAQPNALEWAFSTGSNGYEYGNSLSVDPAGDVLVTGNFSGTTDFDPSTGISNLISYGPEDIFFAKYTADGDLIWAQAIACTSFAKAHDITTDNLGNVYVTGYFSIAADFDPQPGNPFTDAHGQYDTFFAKYDPTGALVFVKTISSTSNVYARRIRVDGNYNIILAGEFRDTTDFDPDTSAFMIESAGNIDLFLARYDSSGNYLWVRRAGGQAAETATSLDVDTSGNIYFAGHFFGTFDFDPGPGVSLLSTTGASDIYFSSYTSSGNLLWVKQIGSPGFDQVQDLKLDVTKKVLIAGLCSPFTDFDPAIGVAYRDSMGFLDIFTAKYSNQGNFVFAKTYGSSGIDEAYGITSDADENIYVTGVIADTTDFNPDLGTNIIATAGMDDAFVTSFNTFGLHRWAFTIAGPHNDKGIAIQATAAGDIYVTGGFSDTADFEPDSTLYSLTSVANTDMFLARFSRCSNDSILVHITSCDSALYNGQYYQSPGTYIFSYTPALGCDSTVVLELAPEVIDTSVTLVVATFTSNATGVTYQWIDCGNGNIPLPGETMQSFTATVNGIYAVVLSLNGCTDTSACITINNVGLSESASAGKLTIYPNPAHETSELLFSNPRGEKIKIELYDVFGSVLQSTQFSRSCNVCHSSIDLAQYSSGTYILKMTSTDGIVVRKIIKH